MAYVIAGATSATGNCVVQKLCEKVEAGRITCFVRSTSDTAFLDKLGLRQRVGDVTDPDSLAAVLDAASIYIDMTHPKFYHRSLEAVVRSGVERAFFVTTTGIFSHYNHLADIYRANEAKIRSSGIVYTILRPSMIYGSSRDKNMNRLIRFLNRSPLFPLFGDGKCLMQPVYVEDLADGIVAAIGECRTENRDYNLAGPAALAYRDLVEIILRELRRGVLRVPINPTAATFLARCGQCIPGFPITVEQVLRLREDKVFDISPAIEDLNYQPRPFEDGVRREIIEMRLAGVLS